MRPPKRILDPAFRYSPSHETDLRKTFERVRRELEQLREAQQTGVAANVVLARHAAAMLRSWKRKSPTAVITWKCSPPRPHCGAKASSRYSRAPARATASSRSWSYAMTLTAMLRLEDAYGIGIEIAARLPARRVAIALRGRRASEAHRFIELVAANRGGDVRYFESVSAARGWLLGER
jgi:hypothetical protein